MFFPFLCFFACAQDDDGSIPVSSSDEVYSGQGFFLAAELDSGKFIHLAKDTLFFRMDSIWSFTNCALKRIRLNREKSEGALNFYPIIRYETTVEDCPSPYMHPDTTLKVLLGDDVLDGVGTIRVYNDLDSLLDTILVRRGKFSTDTFTIYIDSLFDTVSTLPLRTKNSPSVFKLLDSLTAREFYWRPMKSTCTHRVDNCEKTVNDTIYPTSWLKGDTALVPIRQSCQDTTLVYCIRSRWKDDSTSLGAVQVRPDTIWHTSTYYMESIPKCGSMNEFVAGRYTAGRSITVRRQLYVPAGNETFCGPSIKEDLFIYDIGRNRIYPDTLNPDTLIDIWNKAKVSKDSTAKPKK